MSKASVTEDQIPWKITIRDKYGPAMEMKTKAEADAYFAKLVEHNCRCQDIEGKEPDEVEAVRVEKINLGYYAGYYDQETRARVEELFDCAHPYFGKLAMNGPPSPETAYNIGAAIGGAMRRS